MGIAIFYVRWRSCYRDVLYKKGVLKNFPKFTGKQLCQSLFFNKVADWRIGWLCHRFFPVNFEKFLRTPFFKEQIRWLLMSDVNVFQVKSCLHLFILNHAFSITFWYFGRLKIILLLVFLPVVYKTEILLFGVFESLRVYNLSATRPIL